MLVYACISAWKLDENSGTPAAGDIDICKLADKGDGNWIQILCKCRNWT